MEGGDLVVMAGIDERVVSMTMRSADFVANASRVLQALTMLKNSLNSFKGSGKALGDLDAAGKKVDLSGIGKGIDELNSKFNTLRVIAVGALLNIGMAALRAAGNLVKSFTVDPIIAGLHEYENELNTTAVIMANTGLSGEKGMAQIRTALSELNSYADKTIYSFEDMTSAIGKFTAAGVSLQDSVTAIKGLANLAALSGSTAQQAATAQYQLSQAIATGTVKLMDWNSVVNAGMGGKVFQNALIQTARVHGVAVDSMIKKNGSFRDSLQEGWLTSKILLETLSKLTGDLSAQQLKQMGYTDKQIAAIQKQAQAAVDAATKIRTVTQLISTVGEAVQSAWAGVFRVLFGNMAQATALWTGLGKTLGNVFVTPINNLKTLLAGWAELGGRTVLIEAIASAFRSLGAIMKSIGTAFRDVFPATTAARLFDMTVGFKAFIDSLKPSASTLEHIHSIFEGLFSGIKLGIDIIKGIFSVFGQMIHAATGLGGGILELVAKIGDFVTGTKDAAESGDRLSNFFKTLGTILSAPVKVLSTIVQLLSSLAIAGGKALSALGPFFSKVVEGFSKLGDAVANSIKSGNFSQIMTAINSVLFGGVLLSVRKFIGQFTKGLGGGGGLVDTIKSIFGGLTDTLKAMQANLNAGTLQKIAIAVGILTIAVVALSLVNAAALAKSLGAIAVGMGQLAAMMAVLSKIGPVGIAQLFVISVGLNLLATAVVILAGAVAIFAQFSLVDLAKGLVSVAASMAILVGAVRLMGKGSAQVISTAIAMVLLAAAMNLMALAVKSLAKLDWGSLLKGVGTIAVLLTLLAAFNKFGGAQTIATGAGLILVGIALNVIARALKSLGSLDIASIGKGLLAIAGSLLIIAAGMTLMPPNMLLTAAGLLVVSAALTILAKALTVMGGMSWGEIAKSLVTLAGSLIILAAAMMLMTGALPGAAALLVISTALMILTPVLVTLAAIPWSGLLKALGALALVLLLLGAAGLVLGPLAPALLAVGAALVLFGVAMLAVGAGVALIGVGLTAIGIAVTTAGAAIVSFVKGILGLIPYAMGQIGAGIAAFANSIAKAGPAIIKAFVAILTSLLTGISRVLPLIIRVAGQILTGILGMINKYSGPIITTFINLLLRLLSTIASNVGKFVQKGVDIIVGFLRGIASNMGRIVRAGVDVVVAFINGVSANLGRIIAAGIRLALSFVNGVANGIRSNTGAIRSAGANIGSALIEGAIAGIAGMAGGLVSAAMSAVGNAVSAMWSKIRGGSPSKETILVGESMMQGLVLGMTGSISEVVGASDKVSGAMLSALKDSLSGVEAGIGDINPVITPVIDLSLARRGFDDLAAMSASSAYTAAIASSIAFPEAIAAEGPVQGAVAGTILTFTQNNTSPKALSEAEIYRQTKNQLSAIKGALP
jgi:tape measure domain-containing protein